MIYIWLYMSNFFLISSNLIICKKKNAKIIFLIIIFFIIIIIFLVSNIRTWLSTVVSSQKPKNVLVSIQKDDWLSRRFFLLTIPVIIDSHVRNISEIESEKKTKAGPSHLTCDLIVLFNYDGYFLKCVPFYAYARFIYDIQSES